MPYLSGSKISCPIFFDGSQGWSFNIAYRKIQREKRRFWEVVCFDGAALQANRSFLNFRAALFKLIG